MPLMRYFLWVGGTLVALMFIADAYGPKLPPTEMAAADLPVIRIQSDQKWPDRVVYNTSPQANPAHPTTASRPYDSAAN